MKADRVQWRRASTALPVAGCLALLGACNIGWGAPQQPSTPTTASVTVMTSFASAGAITCTDTFGTQWTATPLAVPPGPGTSTAVTASAPPMGNFSPTGNRCYLSHLFGGLQPGRWRMAVAAGVASGACDVELKSGIATVELVVGGCSVTP